MAAGKTKTPKKEAAGKAAKHVADTAEAAGVVMAAGKKPAKKEVAGKAAKHVADTAEAAGLTGRALKARTCFNWQRKGRCPRGDACPKLHAGEPSANRAAHVQKVVERKSHAKEQKERAPQEEGSVGAGKAAGEAGKAKRKAGGEAGAAAGEAGTAAAAPAKRLKKGKHPPWKCPRCHNENWGRRSVCNGRVCGGLRPGSEPAAPGPDGAGA